MKTKIIALFLAIAALVSVFSMTTMSAYAALLYEVSNPIQKSYQPSYPLNEFQNGSHFNDLHFNEKIDNSSTACTHHGNCDYNSLYGCACTNYASSVQCAAFAKYAFDQYNHCSKWDPLDAEKKLNGMLLMIIINIAYLVQ